MRCAQTKKMQSVKNFFFLIFNRSKEKKKNKKNPSKFFFFPRSKQNNPEKKAKPNKNQTKVTNQNFLGQESIKRTFQYLYRGTTTVKA